MHHKSSRRRQLVARTFVYSLMTVSVIVIVTILMFVILGYSFNEKDGKIEQGGLLQFASIPSGAYVTLDQQSLSSRTPSKSTVEAKSHFVQMNLDGYRTWQKTVTVKAGGIAWLSYARLIPTDISTKTLRTFTKFSSSLAATDHKWMAMLEDAATPTITLADLGSSTPTYSSINIPNDIVTQATTQSYQLVAWSDNDGYMLVKRTYDDNKTEWLVIDRDQPEQSVNITTTYAINITNALFNGTDNRQLVVRSDDNIVRRLNLDSKTLSVPMIENVNEFSVTEDGTLMYVTQPDTTSNNQQHVGYRTEQMSQPVTIYSYDQSVAGVHIATGTYYGKTYVGVTHGTTLEVYSGTLPTVSGAAKLQKESSTALASAATALTLTPNERFFVAQITDGYVTRDIDLAKSDTTKFTRTATVERALQWLDDYMIWSDRAGELRFFEFDGANQQDIMQVAEGQAVTLSDDDKYVYGFHQTENGMEFVQAKLIIN